jgi:prepilin-type N-terminal cleavage/methylation domain-containing protein
MMKAMQRSKWMHDQGFSLIELVIVVGIISLLLAIAGISGKKWMDRYNAESQIRMMHADLMQTRVKALGRNRQYFVAVNTRSYQVIEDTNENGVLNASPNDTWQTLKTLNYPVSLGTGTITMDERGLVTTGTSTITFNTGSDIPEYDCMRLYATRINIGRMNGTNCVPR